ncbi:MAG: hypothetical protein J6I55_11600, partial [Ruminococcus sp.]|nr:hypothetical protein [Ruminococcus sp.]
MKRKQKRVSKRILASALTAALCMNYVPVLAVAEGESEVNSESKQVGVDDIVEVSPDNEKFSETETSDENHENESADVVPENSISYTESEYTVNISPVSEDVTSVYEVDINGKRDTISVNNGDKLVLHARIKEGVEKLYRISDVRIGNTAVDAKNAENFDVDIEITPDMADENGNIQVTVDFTRVYTASFYYNPNDESITPSTEIKVTDDNGNAIGTATFNDDGNMRFAAVPNNNYRVSSVIVDGKYTNYDENDKSVLIENVSSDNEHYIDAVFALNNCSIQSEESVNGTVNATVDNVVYGGISEIMLTPDKGCYLKSVFINDKPFDVSNMHSGGKITIDGVTEDKHIKAEFRKYSDDYSWNYDNAIKSEGEKYIFGKDRTVLFHTELSGIRLIDENNAVILGDENTDSLSINSDREKITVSAVDIYYNENGWQRVSLEKPIEISFYENIAASLTLPEYNEGCMCYGSDVRIKMNVTSESMYSLISSVEYWIDDSEEHHTLKSGQNEILIPAEGNNRADMVVHAVITDILGSKTEIETEPFSINSVVPTVEIFSDDSISDEADDAHYTNGRTFRVTVDDAAYTQKQDLSMFSITKDGEVLSDKEKSNIVTWIKDGSKLTALLNFSDDGKYSWNMLYINKAGKHNETVNTNGDDIYNFVLDNTFEEAYVKVGSKALNELLDVLTFGVMGNSDVIVTAEAKDELSGVKGIYFYKDVYSQERTSNKALTYDELENLYKENMFKPYNGEIVVPENEKAVVYVRFVDGAGNVVYRTSDGMIIDSLRSNVSINADEPNEFGIYNDDIDVNINVTDAFPYSGIQYVEYKVTSGRIVTQSGRFDDFEHDISDESNLQQEFNFDFTILSKLNNSSDVLLTVTVKDNAGNLTETVKSFDINKDNPSVTVSYDNNDAVNDMYFNSPRKATIVIKDRENYFDAAMATESISVIASDKDGNPVENAFTVSEWHSNADTHTADITFLGDAEYKFAVNYVSRSGSTAFAFADSSQKAPFEFVIDKTAPTGSIEIQNNTWSELLDKITFGMYSRQDFDVSASGSDNSGNVKMEYYISNSEKPLDKNYLNRLDESKWQKYTGTFKIPENENKNNRVWVVYLKVSDYAGNYVYICSDGHIIDNQPIDITATVAKNYSKDNTYSDDIEICVQAQDKAPYSSIKRINYWITSDGMITQEGELYNFDNAAPSYSEIENSVRKTFVIDSSLNNSSDVVIYVHAEDNAGNENTISRKFDVDVTKPEISIDYGGDEGKKGGFFSSPRQAKITVIERNSHFDPDTASDSIKITAKNAVGDIIDDAWSLSNWESDGDTHTAIITFSADARYSLSVSYTDKAGNTNAEINTGSSSYPYEFTVDTSAPAGIIKALSADSEYFEWNQFSDEESIPVTGVCKTEINVSSDVSDELSGIDEIVYFKDVFDKDFEKL